MTPGQMADEHELMAFLGTDDVAYAIAVVKAAINQVWPARHREALLVALEPTTRNGVLLSTLTSRQARHLEGGRRYGEKQLRNYTAEGTEKLATILVKAAEVHNMQTIETAVPGLWVKITEPGSSNLVEFLTDGSLIERSLFYQEDTWRGSWDREGDDIYMTIGPYNSVFTFAGEKRLSGTESTERDGEQHQIDVMMFKLA